MQVGNLIQYIIKRYFLLLLIIQWLGQTDNSVTSDDQF